MSEYSDSIARCKISHWTVSSKDLGSLLATATFESIESIDEV